MTTYTGHSLSLVGRQLTVPCNIKLLGDGETGSLEIVKVLRILPGKRLTAIANHDGKTVVAKLFFRPKSWQRHLDKELSGIQEIQTQGFNAPGILGQYQLSEEGSVILLEYLESAINLADYFSESRGKEDSDQNSHDLNQVLDLVFQLLCDCHSAGLWQRDMHLGNYMLYQQRLYLVDGADIELLPEAASKPLRLENIADFISLFPVNWDDRIDFMLAAYKKNYASLTAVDSETVLPLVRKLRLKRLAHIEKKAFRASSANRKVKNIRRYYVHDRHFDEHQIDKFVVDPSVYLGSNSLLKDGDTTTVGETELVDIPLVVKRYNITSFGKWLAHLWTPSRAHRCWKNAIMLSLLGVNTPRPYLFLEERWFWIVRLRAYFLSEKVHSENLLEQLQSDRSSINTSDLINAFEAFFGIMKNYQISHGDMKATNFIFLTGKLYVLDLDSMKRHRFKWWANRKHLSDIRRFEKNWRGSAYEETFAPLIEKLYSREQGIAND